jgi:hypothetical protein
MMKHKQWSSLWVLARPDQNILSMVKQAIYETYLHLKDLEKKANILYSINLIYNLWNSCSLAGFYTRFSI